MCCVACTSEQNSKVNINVVRADSLLNQVLALYEVKEYGLLLENYPPKENERATYLLIQRKYITLSPGIDHQLLLFTAGTSKRSPSEHKKVLGKTSRKRKLSQYYGASSPYC